MTAGERWTLLRRFRLGKSRAAQNVGTWPIAEPQPAFGAALAIPLAAICVVVVLWAAIAYESNRSEDAAIAQAIRDARKLTLAFAEHIHSTVGAIDQLMVALIAVHEADPGAYIVPEWVGSLPFLQGMALHVSLVGPDGIVRVSNAGVSRMNDVSARPHFRHHLDPSALQPYISVPIIGRLSKTMSIQFTRRLTRNGSNFDGVIAVSVDPSYFSHFLASLNLGEHGIAIMAGLDGVVRAQRGLERGGIGHDIGSGRLFQQMRLAESGSYVGRSKIDGINRISAFKTVPHYPLVVNIGLATNDVLAAPRRERNALFTFGSIGTLIIIVLTWFLSRETKRRQNGELKQRQDSFRLLFEDNPVPMFVYDITTLGFSAVNNAAMAHFGYSREQFSTVSVPDILPAINRNGHAAIEKTWADNHTEVSRRFQKSNGTTFEAEIYSRPLPYQGRMARFVAVIDVTARRYAEEERDRNRAFLDRVIESVPVTIYVKNASDNKYILINRAGEKMWGLPRADIIGKTTRDLFPNDEAYFTSEHDRKLLESNPENSVSEYTLHTPNNGMRLVLTRRQAIADNDGNPQYLLGVVEDVTERKAIEAQLRQSQKMEVVGNLTGGVAHDFNNLLTIIIGNLDLLQGSVAGNPAAEETIETILKASERGAELTRQMLAFSRRQPLQPKPVVLNQLVRDTMRLLSRTLGEDITVDLQVAEDVGIVLVDGQQLESALVNIALNARHAMPGGGRLTVATRSVGLDADYAARHPEIVPGAYAAIEMTDTGTGMPAEVLEHIFEPFFTTKAVGSGTGLGLSMVYGLIKQSGGHIHAYSEVGRGTTFKLYLPLGQQGAVHADVPERLSSAVATGGDAGNGEMILTVDDNVDVRATVIMQLKALGYRVREADGPRAALEILDGPEKIDLLFTDVVMPGGMNGKEFAAKARLRRPHLKVLFTSGFPGTSLNNGAEFEEGDVLLSKPYRKLDLARTLRDVLTARQRVIS